MRPLGRGLLVGKYVELGVFSAAGKSTSEFWQKVRDGESVIGPLTIIPTEDLHVTIGAEIRDFEPKEHFPSKQLALLVEATHDVTTPAFITGDFNAEPDSNVYDELASRGWIDSHLAAGNGECNSATGENCTSGRDEVGGDLEDPALNLDARIDYIFVVGGIEVLKHAHLTDSEKGHYPSDHLPVLADIKFSGAK